MAIQGRDQVHLKVGDEGRVVPDNKPDDGHEKACLKLVGVTENYVRSGDLIHLKLWICIIVEVVLQHGRCAQGYDFDSDLGLPHVYVSTY